MATRIVNRLAPDEEGILFDTVEEAEAALEMMIKDYKRQGFTVTETDEHVDGKPCYSVVDASRRPFGIYYLET